MNVANRILCIYDNSEVSATAEKSVRELEFTERFQDFSTDFSIIIQIIILLYNNIMHITLVYQVQMIPSSSGDRVGRRPIQRAALPLQSETASRWKKWRVASAGGMPRR